eukprot:1189648-Prorocentrum_minimum.AAC.3
MGTQGGVRSSKCEKRRDARIKFKLRDHTLVASVTHQGPTTPVQFSVRASPPPPAPAGEALEGAVEAVAEAVA